MADEVDEDSTEVEEDAVGAIVVVTVAVTEVDAAAEGAVATIPTINFEVSNASMELIRYQRKKQNNKK